jgi:two-component system, OmpR family, sensor histidine kinase MtrB
LWSSPRHWPDLWRRSIQVRIVAGTLLMSTVVVILVGWVMMNQVTEGVLSSRRDGARTEAGAQVRETQTQLNAADFGTGQNISSLLNQLIAENVNRGADGLYDVVMLVPADAQSPSTTSIRGTAGVLAQSVPEKLRSQVVSDPEALLWDTYTEIRYADGRPPVPALAIGSPLRLNSTRETFELYYLFPLVQQQQTLDVVQRALVTAGLLLVILLGAVAWLVTRQVVSPVRMARRTAERFAAGRLEERMQVRGADDLARLAISFNQMASGLQRHIRRLEELSRLQRRFVSDVSHELRTPLTTVRMAADLLHEARVEFEPVARRSVELLQNELNRFEALLADLLEISRFDAGAAALELDDVDLRDIVHRVVEGSRTLLEHGGADVHLRLPDEPVTAQVDQRRIERILRNLVGNAIEHSDGRPIEVVAAVADDAVAVGVRDHGVGFRPEEAEMVFSRFWRADPARARTTGGTGLGLSIALEDARLHGGGLDAWGSPGEGAWFRLTLPRLQGGAHAGSPLPARPPDAPRPSQVADLVEVGAPYQKLTREDQ